MTQPPLLTLVQHKLRLNPAGNRLVKECFKDERFLPGHNSSAPLGQAVLLKLSYGWYVEFGFCIYLLYLYIYISIYCQMSCHARCYIRPVTINR